MFHPWEYEINADTQLSHHFNGVDVKNVYQSGSWQVV